MEGPDKPIGKKKDSQEREYRRCAWKVSCLDRRNEN